MSFLSDPIAALATPPGRSALAVVRLSGHGAFEVAGRVVPAFRRDPPRTARLARFLDAAGRELDRGLYLAFPGPASYTGHDLVEFTCHGGLVAPARLLAALHAAGARPAAPGEFTRRAVLNGKLDLLQAEAVGDLIEAGADAQAAAALDQLEGGLSRRVAGLRERLLDVSALLAYDIDFPGEDDGPVPPSRLGDGLDQVRGAVARLLATVPLGERVREGALVVLAGRPNAGKSSLFNALLGRERAIVTADPGTTRDAIEAAAEVDGWPVRLVDTAGLRDAIGVERMGVEVSRRWLGAAHLVLLCVDGGRPLDAEEAALAGDARALLVRTKADLHGGDGPAGGGLRVSATTGQGLDDLRRALAARLFADRAPGGDAEPVLTRARHREALARAAAALDAAREQLPPAGDAVLAAHHLRDATAALDELVGAVDVEEVLGRVFGGFCVGK